MRLHAAVGRPAEKNFAVPIEPPRFMIPESPRQYMPGMSPSERYAGPGDREIVVDVAGYARSRFAGRPMGGTSMLAWRCIICEFIRYTDMPTFCNGVPGPDLDLVSNAGIWEIACALQRIPYDVADPRAQASAVQQAQRVDDRSGGSLQPEASSTRASSKR